MKRVVRSNVFETNSSSSHSFSIRKEILDLHYPRVIHFELGEFYWDTDEDMNSFTGRCNYLYTCAYDFEYLEEFKKMIKKIMPKKTPDGFKVRIDYEDEKDGFDNSKPEWSSHIDHQSVDQAHKMIHDLLLDENLFKNFLFDDETQALIDNDNSYSIEELIKKDRYYVDWSVAYGFND